MIASGLVPNTLSTLFTDFPRPGDAGLTGTDHPYTHNQQARSSMCYAREAYCVPAGPPARSQTLVLPGYIENQENTGKQSGKNGKTLRQTQEYAQANMEDDRSGKHSTRKPNQPFHARAYSADVDRLFRRNVTVDSTESAL